jgi:hypothetical protein
MKVQHGFISHGQDEQANPQHEDKHGTPFVVTVSEPLISVANPIKLTQFLTGTSKN